MSFPGLPIPFLQGCDLLHRMSPEPPEQGEIKILGEELTLEEKEVEEKDSPSEDDDSGGNNQIYPDIASVGEDVNTHTPCLAPLNEGDVGPFAQNDSILMILQNGEVIEKM